MEQTSLAKNPAHAVFELPELLAKIVVETEDPRPLCQVSKASTPSPTIPWSWRAGYATRHPKTKTSFSGFLESRPKQNGATRSRPLWPGSGNGPTRSISVLLEQGQDFVVRDRAGVCEVVDAGVFVQGHGDGEGEEVGQHGHGVRDVDDAFVSDTSEASDGTKVRESKIYGKRRRRPTW